MSGENEFSYESPMVPGNALFVECTDPVRVFPSIRAAELHLESLDLDGGECSVAYGPCGEIYRIRMESATVRIERAEEPDRPDELKHLLLHYFECCEDPWDSTDELKCLVDEAWSIERDYWLRSKADEQTHAHRIPTWALIPFVILIVIALYLLFRR